MKTFTTNPDEFALISVGQLAWGVIAIGQMARGFIAIGQLAIGVVAIGQLAVSVFGAGMAGIGVLWFTGFGIGGRGYCLRLIPAVEPKPIDPQQEPLDRIWNQGITGEVRLDVLPDPRGGIPALGHRGQFLPVKLLPHLARDLQQHWPRLGGAVIARLYRQDNFYVCDQLTTPASAPRNKPSRGFALLRLGALVGLAAAWWVAFGKMVLLG